MKTWGVSTHPLFYAQARTQEARLDLQENRLKLQLQVTVSLYVVIEGILQQFNGQSYRLNQALQSMHQ